MDGLSESNGAWAQVSSDLDPYSLYATYSNGTLYGSIPSVTYPGTLLNANILPQKQPRMRWGFLLRFCIIALELI